MKIIVVGIGKVGYTVADVLSSELHDVTVVDRNEAAVADALEDLDVIGIEGNGAARHVLMEAGVSECDLLIALTGSDEVNLLCCLLARKLGANGTIARVRNPEYNEDLGLVKENLGLSMAVNPEREAAAEILRILKFPLAKNIDVFAKGKIDLVSFVADKRCTLCGKAMKDAFASINAKALVCAVERGNDAFIPVGDSVIEENDTVAALAPKGEISEFFKEIGFPVNGIKNIMIIGGGRIAHYLAMELDRLNMNATIIEKDPKIAEDLSFALPHANVICGDGTDRSLLLEEGLCEMDALCCLTGFDEENILLSLFAKSMAPNIKTITKVNKTAFEEVIRTLNLDSVVFPKYITSNLIVRHVRATQHHIGSDLETLYKIIDNKVEALEFSVGEDYKQVGVTLEKLKLRKNAIIGCINRNGNVFIPHGKDSFNTGDTVIVVTTTSGLTDLKDIEG